MNKKPKIGKSDIVVIIIFLVMIQLLCLWCIDVSVAGMLNGGVLTNGATVQNPLFTYHLGLYGLILSTLGLVIITIHILLKEKKKNQIDYVLKYILKELFDI